MCTDHVNSAPTLPKTVYILSIHSEYYLHALCTFPNKVICENIAIKAEKQYKNSVNDNVGVLFKWSLHISK